MIFAFVNGKAIRVDASNTAPVPEMKDVSPLPRKFKLNPLTQREQQIAHSLGSDDWTIKCEALDPNEVVIEKGKHFRRVKWNQLKEMSF